ncbi:NTE family protein [Enhydrobacter aerosaccus]|uniref:NTE family protein n=2 Tax=Enhydrobacter aerosaccus TaxID=225324 RepID=A0A1T4SAR6_9HYPH|nr:NTE family protein [Enhydrobacter aerosaccus]
MHPAAEAVASEHADERPAARLGQVALVLQGGGALGAYQVGVLRALEEAGYLPDWFAGTSIGAINAAIMAGNAPEQRLIRLGKFWNGISRIVPWGAPAQGPLRRAFNAWSAWQTAAFGQPGFFRWRAPAPWFPSPDISALSYYVADALGQKLKEIIDLDRINSGSVRLSLGAVKLTSGQQIYFDSRTQRIGYEHIMASAALPPAFPPVEIDGEWYWDGGIVSNTPLDVVIDQRPRRSTLCFMVDLFDAEGPLPHTIEDVKARYKDIVYASRSGRRIEAHRAKHDLRRAVMALWEALPPERQKDPHLNALAELGCTTTMHIVRLVHHTEPEELSSKDYDFSEIAIGERIAAGYRDAKAMLEKEPWLDPVPPDIGVVIHELPTRELR